MSPPSKTPEAETETRSTYTVPTTAEDLLKKAIVPALDALGKDSPEARMLLLSTAAHESGRFQETRQINLKTGLPHTGDNGAFGYFQMEVKNSGAELVYNNVLKKDPELMEKVGKLCQPPSDFAGKNYSEVKDVIRDNLLKNPVFGAAMCQISYDSWGAKYPKVDAKGNVDQDKLAEFWERKYNIRETTEEGQAAQRDQFKADFRACSLDSENIKGLITKPANECF